MRAMQSGGRVSGLEGGSHWPQPHAGAQPGKRNPVELARICAGAFGEDYRLGDGFIVGQEMHRRLDATTILPVGRVETIGA
jgi:hypothetical protein